MGPQPLTTVGGLEELLPIPFPKRGSEGAAPPSGEEPRPEEARDPADDVEADLGQKCLLITYVVDLVICICIRIC